GAGHDDLPPGHSLDLGIAAQPAIEQGRLVCRPALGVGVAKLAQVGPAVDAGVVLVVEGDADGVVADRFDGNDLHVTTAGYDLLGRGSAMAHHFGRRTFDAEIFGRQVDFLAVGEVDLDAALGLEHTQLVGPGRILRFVAALVGRRFRDAAHVPSLN